jgi:phytanoyl-CoA hydroxylase
MRTIFDRTAFARDGVCVVRQAVPSGLVAALIKAVERIQASVADLPSHLLERLTLERDLPADKRGGVGASEVGNAIFIVGDPVAFDDGFLSLLDQPKIVNAVREAVEATEIAAHFMNVTIKQPSFGRSIGWHRDYPNAYACPDASRFVRVMLCLDGMSEAIGATTFQPGSHLIGDEEARELSRPGDRPQPPSGEVMFACCDPGDAVVIHPKVLHGGAMNASPRPRRNVVLQAGDKQAPLVAIPEQERIAGCGMGERSGLPWSVIGKNSAPIVDRNRNYQTR